jgi:spermidine synthase
MVGCHSGAVYLFRNELFIPLVTKSAGLLVLSGAAALVYQVVWVRLMGLTMGSTSGAVATVVAAFFGGMALGSALADRFQSGARPTLRAYVSLELIIAVCGLLSLPLLLNLDHVMAALPAGGTSLAAKFGIAFLALGLPTTAMGATFPVMAAALIREDEDLAPRMSQFYALNTAGAVIGAWVSGFVLIPRLGLDGAIYAAAVLNLAAAALGWHLSRQLPAEADTSRRTSAKRKPAKSERKATKATPTTHRGLERTRGVATFALLVLFSTGLVSIANEVAWTKYLAVFTGSTIYGFSAILVAFLIGIAAGSALSRVIQAEWAPSIQWLGIGLLALAASLLIARIGLSYLPAIDYQIRVGDVSGLNNPDAMDRVRYFIILVILLAPTLVLGAIFPASLSLWCGDAEHVPGRVGRGYAVNTAGGILGSLLAGFWLIPEFGSDWILAISVTAIAIIGLAGCVVGTTSARRTRLVVVGAVLATTPLWTPGLSYERLLASAFNLPGAHIEKRGEPEFLYLEEGKVAVVSLVRWPKEEGDTAYLHSNSLREAKLPMDASVAPPRAEVFLGTLPVLMHPNAKSMFIVGFGGGNTLRAALGTKVDEVRIVELEPAMVDAVSSFRGGAFPALEDPRTTLVIGDARNVLLVDDRKYDVIASQPSHPWVAGAGNLFTREFFEIARSRLNPGGIHSQWVSLFGLDATSLQSILRAFFQTYVHGYCLVLKETGDLLMLGSNEPVTVDFAAVALGIRSLETHAWFDSWQVTSAEALLWYFALSRDGALAAAGDVQANSDTTMITEVRGGFGHDRRPDDPASPYRLLDSAFQFDVIDILNPATAADNLDLMARTFATWTAPGAEQRARYALKQLAALDFRRARDLAAELRISY